jgi:hypothetical protein
VGVLDLTQGEMLPWIGGAARGRSETAAHVMGLAVRENLGLPDAGIRNDDDTRG